jgi:cytochrome bd-type quinol oxidase subunit 1
MPKDLDDGTPLSTIQQILFDESQSRPKHQQHQQQHQEEQTPLHHNRVRFEEPIPTAISALSDVDPMDVIQKSMKKMSSFENSPPVQHSAARQIMNSVIVSFVVFVALYIFPFLQSTPTEYRASTIRILIIAIAMGIAVLYIQKSLR